MCDKKGKEKMEKWRIQSSDEIGFHEVITPLNSDCIAVQMFRLNMEVGQTYVLISKKLELHSVLIKGKAEIKGHPSLNYKMEKLDSFYIPSNDSVKIIALEECIFYIAGAKCEG